MAGNSPCECCGQPRICCECTEGDFRTAIARLTRDLAEARAEREEARTAARGNRKRDLGRVRRAPQAEGSDAGEAPHDAVLILGAWPVAAQYSTPQLVGAPIMREDFMTQTAVILSSVAISAKPVSRHFPFTIHDLPWETASE